MKIKALHAPIYIPELIDAFIYRWYHGLAMRDGEQYPLYDFAFIGSGSSSPLELYVNTRALPRVCSPGENLVVNQQVHDLLLGFNLQFREVFVSRGFEKSFTVGDLSHRKGLLVPASDAPDESVARAAIPIEETALQKTIKYWEILTPFPPIVEKVAESPGRVVAFPVKMVESYIGPVDYEVDCVFDLEELEKQHILTAGAGFVLSSEFAKEILPLLDWEYWQMCECEWVPC